MTVKTTRSQKLAKRDEVRMTNAKSDARALARRKSLFFGSAPPCLCGYKHLSHHKLTTVAVKKFWIFLYRISPFRAFLLAGATKAAKIGVVRAQPSWGQVFPALAQLAWCDEKSLEKRLTLNGD
jgi:hypothetical protein